MVYIIIIYYILLISMIFFLYLKYIKIIKMLGKIIVILIKNYNYLNNIIILRNKSLENEIKNDIKLKSQLNILFELSKCNILNYFKYEYYDNNLKLNNIYSSQNDKCCLLKYNKQHLSINNDLYYNYIYNDNIPIGVITLAYDKSYIIPETDKNEIYKIIHNLNSIV